MSEREEGRERGCRQQKGWKWTPRHMQLISKISSADQLLCYVQHSHAVAFLTLIRMQCNLSINLHVCVRLVMLPKHLSWCFIRLSTVRWGRIAETSGISHCALCISAILRADQIGAGPGLQFAPTAPVGSRIRVHTANATANTASLNASANYSRCGRDPRRPGVELEA